MEIKGMPDSSFLPPIPLRLLKQEQADSVIKRRRKQPLFTFRETVPVDSRLQQGKLILDEDRDPWDQQRGESTRCFQMFLVYRELPTGHRTYRAVAAQMGKTAASISQRAATDLWQERVELYERHLGQIAATEQEAARVNMVKRHIRVSEKLLNILEDRIDTLDPDEVSPRELAALLKASVEVERLSRGEVTSRVDIRERVAKIARAEGLEPDEINSVVQEAEKYLAGLRRSAKS